MKFCGNYVIEVNVFARRNEWVSRFVSIDKNGVVWSPPNWEVLVRSLSTLFYRPFIADTIIKIRYTLHQCSNCSLISSVNEWGREEAWCLAKMT